MNLENILSELNQTQKVTYCIIQFICNVRIGKYLETDNKLLLARAGKMGIGIEGLLQRVQGLFSGCVLKSMQ